MSELENAYCRLCAELKSSTKLVNLLSEDAIRYDIVTKLKRININIEFIEDSLPNTVCYQCTASLDKAFELILEIEKAQEVLEDIILVKNIKKEEFVSSDFDNDLDQCMSYDVDIKLEDTNTRDSKKPNKYHEKKKKKSIGNDLDGIPLSQLKLTWQEYSWQCAYCGTLFPTIDELKTHSIQYHECCNPYRCTDCNIRKLKLDSFIAHVKRHRKYLKLSCYKCHKKFSKITDVKLHHNLHVDSNFYCTGCNQTFNTSGELTDHSNAYNRDLKIRQLPPIAKEKLESLNCPICQKLFKYKGTLTNHLLTHTERKREHTCEKCGKRFLSKQNLAGHMMLHDDIRPYPCEICKFRFRTPAQLRMHVGIHDGIKPFECDQCGRCFRLRKQLVNHSIVHTDALPYVCSYCNKAFRFKSILNQHIRQHTGIKPYSCHYCERNFTNWPNYNKHMKRRHGVDMAKKKRTPKGVYPLDPVTGELVLYEETNKTHEWKSKLLEGSRKPGRPKVHNHDKANVISDQNVQINDIKT
ncbi:zinc finger protein 883-like [Maniola jurtina]|uniref:zinc finger protein 883-like n=1 Tax=Maniola jurtina TaxID=191418 RepID=UPI001E68C049|nr:zinc finger protein 883-like [Maniola jurtina]